MAKAKQPAAAPGTVTVAALKDVHIEGVPYPCGALVALPAALAAAYADEVDAAPAAVAHRRSVGALEFHHKG
ncbi:MAG: hypothetical protein RIR91_948 [Verrucomicrobiota bacterium]|jgi:hypothetical protein